MGILAWSIGARQAELVQRLGEGRGDEEHVIAFAAGGRDLAHDFFVGGVHGDLEVNAGRGLELLGNVLGHVAVPVGNHQLVGLGHRYAGHEGNRAAKSQCCYMLEIHGVSLPAWWFLDHA